MFLDKIFPFFRFIGKMSKTSLGKENEKFIVSRGLQ
jgi:hypothetical protein